MTRFEQVQPVLPTRDVPAAIEFYVDRLGFSLAFRDSEDDPRYAGVRRDGVELHLIRWPVAQVVHAGASDSAVRWWADGRKSATNRLRAWDASRGGQREAGEGQMSDRRPVGIVLHEKADRMYVICDDGTAYSAKVGHPGIVMGWHEIDPIPGTAAAESVQGAFGEL